MLVRIVIGDETGRAKVWDNEYSAYTIDSQYNFIADSFEVTLVDVSEDVKAGDTVAFYYDKALFFRGIIDSVDKAYSKDSRTMQISGRSRVGLLSESYCRPSGTGVKFPDYDKLPYLIVDDLIAQTAFFGHLSATTLTNANMDDDEVSDYNEAINLDVKNQTLDMVSKVTYSEEFRDLTKKKLKIDPGDTIWEKIYQLITECGYEAIYQDDELWIGDMRKKRLKLGSTIYVTPRPISGHLSDSIADRYSTIVLIGSSEQDYTISSGKFTLGNTKTVTDGTLTHKKYYIAESNNTKADALLKKAVKMREDQRMGGYKLTYVYPDHVDNNGEIWKINYYVAVQDDVFNLSSTDKYVIMGRQFKFDVGNGYTTELTINKERQDVKDLT